MNWIQKVGADLLGLKSYYAPGVSLLFGSSFTWMGGGKAEQLKVGYANKIVYSAVQVVVSKLIEVPLIVAKEKNRQSGSKWISKKNFSDFDIASGGIKLLRAKALDELDNHALIDLLQKPNRYCTGIELMEAFWLNNKLCGDGFIWAERNEGGSREGQPVYLHVLPSQNVFIVKNEDDWRSPVLAYRFTTWTGIQIDIPPTEVLHMANWSPNDPSLGGYSAQSALSRTIAKNEQNQIAQGAAFLNGGTGTIISSDQGEENGKVYDKLTTGQVDSIKETVLRGWAGAVNNQKLHVTNGYVNVQKLGDTLAELELIEANKADVEDICAAYGFNSILLGDKTGGTENNVKAAYKALVTNRTITDLRKFDMKFNQWIKEWYKGEKLIVSHDITEFTELAPDLKLLKEVYGDANYITQNEKREIFNFDADPNPLMKDYLIPSGLTFMSQTSDPDFEMPTDGKQYDYN